MYKRTLLFCFLAFLFYGCSTTEQIVRPQPQQPVDSVDFSSLEEPPKNWHHFDETFTQFRGISSKLVYQQILDEREPQQMVVVAVIDGGVDINHEDLQGVIWVNKDEVPDNGVDDDDNGYVDDIHGWNFIGGPDGKSIDNATFELTRIYARLHPKFADVDTTALSAGELKKYAHYQEIKEDYRHEIEKLLRQYRNIRSLEKSMNRADQLLTKHFNGSYTEEEVHNLQPQNRQLSFAKNVMGYVMENNIDSTLIAEQKKHIYEYAKYGYNPNFNPRTIVGDNISDKTERYYGNNDVIGPDASHGTHVAGIIGAVRNNGIGMNGIANSVRIMAVRAVPNGDERDKDVANAIRYAVNNGADIINMSFGKGYSPYKEVVDAAVKYADEHSVLMVHAAGNDGANTDTTANYPTDIYGPDKQGPTADLWLSVGASGWKPDSAFVASFSNYGSETVDLFAPGVAIYSTVPDDKYERYDGTSMAAPVVSGVAAVLMAYYPDLSTQQIRTVLMKSVEPYPHQMVTLPHGAGEEAVTVPFANLSVSDGVVNLFNALQVAEKMSK